MLDFLLDNPYILFLVIYAVISLVRKGRASAAGQKDRAGQAAARTVAPAESARRPDVERAQAAVRGLSLEERLQQLAVDWERKLSGDGVQPGPAQPAVASPSVQPVPALSSASATEPFAEPAVTEVVAGDRAADLESRSAFDLTRRTRFQVAPVAGATQATPFAFVEASPASEDRWHLRGFDTAGAAGPSPAPLAHQAAQPDEASTIEQRLSQPGSLARAVLLAEVLAKPRSLRPWSPRARA